MSRAVQHWTPLPAVVWALLAGGLAAAGTLQYRHQRGELLRRAEIELSAVAELKVAGARAWQREREADAEVLGANPAVLEAVHRASSARSQALVDPLRPWFRYAAELQHCRDVQLLDAHGGVIASLAGAGGPTARRTHAALVAEAIAARHVVFSPIHADDTGEPHLDVVAPLPGRGTARPEGALLLTLDPRQAFESFVRTWPTPSESAEALLVQRSGDEIVYLSPLRHRAGSAVRHQRVAASATLAATIAIREGTGVVRALDYRGVPVVAAFRRVPGTPWTLIAKIDRAEILARAAGYGVVIAALVAALVLAAGAGMALWWRHQRSRFYQRQYGAERQRREAMEALHRSEERLQLALDASGHAIVEWNIVEDRVEVDAALERMLGFGPGTLSAPFARLVTLVHEGDREEVRRRIRAHLAGETDSFDAEFRARTRDREWRWLHARGRVERHADGRPLRLLGTIHDSTEKKKTEAALLVTERMASMGMLAAGVAHEINNPLSYVLTNLRYALEEGGGSTPGEVVAALRDARDGAERVGEIVRDLKTFSRVEDRGRERLDLRAVVRSAINLARNEIRHRAQVVTALADVPLVEASAYRLGQVFLNVLVNAAQAIPEGRAAENEIRVEIRAEGGRAVVDISDTGSGIEPELLPRVFEPFFTTKPPGVGTGLGLSICRDIVSSLGGEIEVESEPGRGTRVRITLPPATGESPAAHAELSAAPGTGRRGRVLVLDDEPLVAASISRILGADHEVASELGARAALDRILAGERFDLVLCDLMMPDMTGMEFHAELTRAAPETAGRVMFMTGGAFTDDTRTFLAGLGEDVIEKPFDPVTLRKLVAERVAARDRAA